MNPTMRSMLDLRKYASSSSGYDSFVADTSVADSAIAETSDPFAASGAVSNGSSRHGRRDQGDG